LTDDTREVDLEDLIRVCYVFPLESIPNLGHWTSLSADHFYAEYWFPSLKVKFWADREPVHDDIDVCIDCCREKIVQTKAFVRFARRPPLRALDLFGGVGALSLPMEESGFLKVTHAVEISPSAAKTFKSVLFLSPLFSAAP